ncbi:MAG: hypothetical protein HYZ53_16745 [Planctomycetes bacterium]|nr:hypothetical protein [Planctomycetota bacterium]
MSRDATGELSTVPPGMGSKRGGASPIGQEEVMLKCTSVLVVWIGLALALAGCTATVDGPHILVEGHVHTATCGHYWDGHGWVVIANHAHGPGCGHFYSDGRWILAVGAPTVAVTLPSAYVTVPLGHAHSATCGHCWDGHGWVVLAQHVHGPSCGHYFVNGQWTLSLGAPSLEVGVSVPAVHVHSAACGHYWDGHAWLLQAGHVHGAGCGHVFLDGQWAVVVDEPAVEVAIPGLYVEIPVGHVHSAECGHCYDAGCGKWVLVESHVHGPGCGHFFANGQWTVTIDLRGKKKHH